MGICHADYEGRLVTMLEIQKAQAEGKIGQVAIGFERIGEISKALKTAPALLLKKLDSTKIDETKSQMEQSLLITTPDERQGAIDCITRLAMVEMCKKAKFSYIQLDTEPLLKKLDKELKQGSDDAVLMQYENARIAGMLQNIEKLIGSLPQENSYITIFVGNTHVPTLTVACRKHFNQGDVTVVPSGLFSTQGSKEMGYQTCEQEVQNRGNVVRNFVEQKCQLPKTATKEKEKFIQNIKLAEISAAGQETVAMRVQEVGTTVRFSTPAFENMMTQAAQHLKSTEESKDPTLSKPEIFTQATLLVRKSNLEELPQLLEAHPWLTTYKDDTGSGLLHMCTNSSTITSKAFAAFPNKDDLTKEALEKRGEVVKLLISKGADINARNNVKAGVKVVDGTGENPKDILKRIIKKSDALEIDKNFAQKLLTTLEPTTQKVPKKEIVMTQQTLVSKTFAMAR